MNTTDEKKLQKQLDRIHDKHKAKHKRSGLKKTQYKLLMDIIQKAMKIQ